MIKHCKRPSGYVCVLVALLSSLLMQRAIAQAPPDMIALPGLIDRCIVSFLPDTPVADRVETARRAGATPLVDLGLINAISVRIPGLDILAALQGDSSVVKVVKDQRTFALQAHFDGGRSRFIPASSEIIPAGVARAGEPAMGGEGSGAGIMIGDTGIDRTHPDLRAAQDKFDALGGDCTDRNGHGPHVAGAVAALKNGHGVVGVAPGATLCCGKVLANNGAGSDSNIIELLQRVLNKNAAGANPPILVIKLSLGRDKEDGDRASTRSDHGRLYAGMAVIVAAGNDRSVEVKDQAPSRFPEVIAVASPAAEEGLRSKCPFVQGTIGISGRGCASMRRARGPSRSIPIAPLTGMTASVRV